MKTVSFSFSYKLKYLIYKSNLDYQMNTLTGESLKKLREEMRIYKKEINSVPVNLPINPLFATEAVEK